MKFAMKSADLTYTGTTMVQEGIDAAKSGDKALARSLLLRAVEHDSNDETGWLWLAYLAENLSKAVYYLRRVLEINPRNDRARASLNKALLRHGIALAKAGSKEQARALLLEASYLDPDSEPVWLLLASVAGNTDYAVACLSRALEINPANEQTISRLNKLGSQTATPVESLVAEAHDEVVAERKAQAVAGQAWVEDAVRASEEAEAQLREVEARWREEAEARAEADARAREEARARAEAEQTLAAAEARAEYAVRASQEGKRRWAEVEVRALEAEARLQEAEARWREEAEARAEAEQALAAAEARAEDAVRASLEVERRRAEAEARALEAEAQLQEAEARWKEKAEAQFQQARARWREKAEARAMAERRVKETQEEFNRSVDARREAEMARADAAAREEAEARAVAGQSVAAAEAGAEDAVRANAEAHDEQTGQEAHAGDGPEAEEAEEAEAPVAEAHAKAAAGLMVQAGFEQKAHQDAQAIVEQTAWVEELASAEQAVREASYSSGQILALGFEANDVVFKTKHKLLGYGLIALLLIAVVWLILIR